MESVIRYESGEYCQNIRMLFKNIGNSFTEIKISFENYLINLEGIFISYNKVLCQISSKFQTRKIICTVMKIYYNTEL
jgi:hypothetical protein